MVLGLGKLLFWLSMAGVTGATVYSAIALEGARRFRKALRSAAVHAARVQLFPPVSILKPLYGADPGLLQNLESFCRQNYGEYEILFSVRDESDAAVVAVRQLQRQFPKVPIRLLVIGPPIYENAKVHGLEEMIKAAAHDILIINDSKLRASPEYLQRIVEPFGEPLSEPQVRPAVGMVTCITRGVPGNGIWSLLEALHVNTHFAAGVLSAWVVEGIRFALGPTMVIRKQQVRELGGIGFLGDFLADDFVLGNRVAEAGYRIALAGVVPEVYIGDESMRQSLLHRLRWERSSRFSRPLGYIGQVFTHNLPLALMAWLLSPADNPYVLSLLGCCVLSRAALVWAVGWTDLRDPVVKRYWWLVPVQDFLSFAVWCWGFLGRKVYWRGAWLRVGRQGKVLPASLR